jgi:hypothetical protein
MGGVPATKRALEALVIAVRAVLAEVDPGTAFEVAQLKTKTLAGAVVDVEAEEAEAEEEAAAAAGGGGSSEQEEEDEEEEEGGGSATEDEEEDDD